MPIAVPRSEMGAKIETSAGSIVSSAVKPAKKQYQAQTQRRQGYRPQRDDQSDDCQHHGQGQ